MRTRSTTDPQPTEEAQVSYVIKLNYPGDVREKVLGKVVGPDGTGKQYLTIKEAVFDPESNLTRCGLTYTTQNEMIDYAREIGAVQ